MANGLVTGYAEALFFVASAEDALASSEEELFRFAQTLRTSDHLQSSLSDSSIPAQRRQQIVEDLLGGRASRTTMAVVSMIVGAGRASSLPAIVEAFIERSAASRNKTVATVRTAIELNDDQTQRLTSALNQATGKDVEVKVVVDPSVLGGLVTEIGDDVLDGSVRRRMTQLRESFR